MYVHDIPNGLHLIKVIDLKPSSNDDTDNLLKGALWIDNTNIGFIKGNNDLPVLLNTGKFNPLETQTRDFKDCWTENKYETPYLNKDNTVLATATENSNLYYDLVPNIAIVEPSDTKLKIIGKLQEDEESQTLNLSINDLDFNTCVENLIKSITDSDNTELDLGYLKITKSDGEDSTTNKYDITLCDALKISTSDDTISDMQSLVEDWVVIKKENNYILTPKTDDNQLQNTQICEEPIKFDTSNNTLYNACNNINRLRWGSNSLIESYDDTSRL